MKRKKLQQNLLILFLISNIGLVSYSDEATSLSGICSNDVFLKNTITSLSSAENTNIEDGLSRAYSMLQLGQSKKKLIVLMSDGYLHLERTERN